MQKVVKQTKQTETMQVKHGKRVQVKHTETVQTEQTKKSGVVDNAAVACC